MIELPTQQRNPPAADLLPPPPLQAQKSQNATQLVETAEQFPQLQLNSDLQIALAIQESIDVTQSRQQDNHPAMVNLPGGVP